MPDEEHPELVRDYPATFYDTHNELFDGEECLELRVRLFDILTFLKKQGFMLQKTVVSYLSFAFNAFVNCNSDPVSKAIWVSLDDFEVIDGKKSLRLKFQREVISQPFLHDQE